MSSTARYFPRAPRYVLRPNDQSLMRFAGLSPNGDKFMARLRDLSATGLSFVVDNHEAPPAGATLKIEFEVPEGQRMAWFATVVRVERRTEWDPDLGDHPFTLVALRFREMPEPYRKVIQKSLSGISSVTADEGKSVNIRKLEARAGFTFATLSFSLFAVFYWLSLPTSAWLEIIRSAF